MGLRSRNRRAVLPTAKADFQGVVARLGRLGPGSVFPLLHLGEKDATIQAGTRLGRDRIGGGSSAGVRAAVFPGAWVEHRRLDPTRSCRFSFRDLARDLREMFFQRELAGSADRGGFRQHQPRDNGNPRRALFPSPLASPCADDLRCWSGGLVTSFVARRIPSEQTKSFRRLWFPCLSNERNRV